MEVVSNALQTWEYSIFSTGYFTCAILGDPSFEKKLVEVVNTPFESNIIARTICQPLGTDTPADQDPVLTDAVVLVPAIETIIVGVLGEVKVPDTVKEVEDKLFCDGDVILISLAVAKEDPIGIKSRRMESQPSMRTEFFEVKALGRL